MLPHRVWISSRPYEGREKGGWVDRGAGFTRGINVIKCGSISRSGGEAWQIQLACGLISKSRGWHYMRDIMLRLFHLNGSRPLVLTGFFGAFKVWHLKQLYLELHERKSDIENPHFHSSEMPHSPPTLPHQSVSPGMSTEYFPRLWRHFPLASLESVVGRCKTLLRGVVRHGSVSPPLKSLPGCCGI